MRSSVGAGALHRLPTSTDVAEIECASLQAVCWASALKPSVFAVPAALHHCLHTLDCSEGSLIITFRLSCHISFAMKRPVDPDSKPANHPPVPSVKSRPLPSPKCPEAPDLPAKA